MPHNKQRPDYFPEVIQRSHARSCAYGIPRDRQGARYQLRLSEQELEARRNSQKDFFDIGVQQIQLIYSLLRGTGICMSLTDAEGYVLYVLGDEDIMEYFTLRCCLPGYRWTERDVGTCAIGIVLSEKIPVFIPGECMYLSSSRLYSNAGSPVFAADGKTLMGAITVSSYSDIMHIHTMGLVRQAAESIRLQLLERQHVIEQKISNNYLETLINSDSRGLVNVNLDGRIVQYNTRARHLLSLDGDCIGQELETYLGKSCNLLSQLAKNKGFHSREILARRTSITHFASLDIIHMEDGTVAGGLFSITEKKEMLRVAAEVSGNKALFTFESIVGHSPALQHALHMSELAARGAASVLLSGETGTGKELFAQAIHNAGKRRQMPFVAINCGAIPKELLESELFGYEEGAFTGARKGGCPGKLEMANNGTLFLDEIGDMPLDMQVKLLRVLQSREIRRVGGLHTLSVNIRVIAATNKNLREEIAAQRFRADLFYRISTLTIDIPPLRDRTEDIPLLVRHFLNRYGSPQHNIPDETLHFLRGYPWPGNIRQLESSVERALYVAGGQPLAPEHFGLAHAPAIPRARSNKGSLHEAEMATIRAVLRSVDGNISQAARILGISRPTLYRKLKDKDLQSLLQKDGPDGRTRP